MNKIKGKLIASAIFVTLLIAACVFIDIIPHNYTLEFERAFLNEDYSDTHAEFLYYDGTQWTVTRQSASIYPKSGIISVGITEGILNADLWRLDPVNENCNVLLKNFKLKDNGITVRKIGTEEIYKGIGSYFNIEQIGLEEGGLYIEVLNSDPYFEFQKEFVDDCINVLRENRVSNFICLFLPLTFIYILFLFQEELNRANGKLGQVFLNSAFQKVYPVAFVVLLCAITVFCYRDYLFGNKLFVYQDVGGDSYVQTYPYYMYKAQFYAENGHFPTWSFQSGLGNSVGTGIYDKIAILLGSAAAPYMLAIMQVVKMILSGVLFYAYLRTMKKSQLTSTLFAFCYAYCGHMTVRAAWSTYPGEVLAVALLLWAFEQWFCNKRWYFLPVATWWIFISTSTYFSLLYLGILCGYAIYRYNTMTEKHFSCKKSIFIITGMVVLGMLIAGINPVRSIVNMLNNPRISGEAGMLQDSVKNGMQWFSDVKTLSVMVVRSFAPNALGIDIEEYKGISNYLTDPVFYCGILSLLVIPQLFINEEKKNKIWYGIILALPVLYMVCPVFRNLLSGFTGDYQYRLNSFWIIVVLIYLASSAFEKIYQKSELFSGKLWFLTLSVWCILIFTDIYVYQRGLKNVQLFIALAFLLVYGVTLLFWKKNVYGVSAIILIVSVLELSLMSYSGINDRDVLLKTELSNGQEYDDATNECIALLEEQEENDFYRIAKDYYSVYLSDSMMQGYNGLTSYQGGTSHSAYLLNFVGQVNGAMANMSAAKDSSVYSTNFILGFNSYNEILSMLSTKYKLTKQQQVVEYGFEQVGQCGDVNIFKNNNYLPLGYIYDTYMTQADYTELDNVRKRKIFSKTCVVSEEVADGLGNMIERKEDSLISPPKNLQERLLCDKEEFSLYEQISFEPDMQEGRTLLVSFDVAAETDATGILCYATDGREANGYMNLPIGIKAGQKSYLYEISYTGVDSICITTDRPVSEGQVVISNLKLVTVDSEQYYESYLEEIDNLKQNTMKLENFAEDEIVGSIDLVRAGILFFSIPYNKNWHAYVDGEEVSWLNVNLGFSGVYTTEGKHTIRLKYEID